MDRNMLCGINLAYVYTIFLFALTPVRGRSKNGERGAICTGDQGHLINEQQMHSSSSWVY